MKILFFINVLSAGGKERRLTELLKVLKLRSDCELELAIMKDEIHYKEVLDLKIPIHYLIRRSKRDLTVFRMFFRLCANYSPDIVHCWDSMTAFYSAPVCKILHIKFVNGMITNSPERQNIFNKNWFRAKLTFPFSDLIIGNSEAGLRAYEAPKKKSFFIHNGFNFERSGTVTESRIIRTELRISTRYLIGMVANNSKYKDYKTYIAAAQILLDKRNDITFLALGENTKALISECHIKHENIKYFRLLGKKSSVENYINALDLCVLATYTEGISNSILEYMALGKPVIATTGGGTSEIVIDKETGLLIGKSDPEELAEKIEIIVNNGDLLRTMGVAGRERIRNFFSIEKMVNNYISLYYKVISKHSTRRMSLIKKMIRESLAFLLIQIHFLKRSEHKGITSIYFHNPSKALFERILIWLKTMGFKFISINELDHYIHEKRVNDRMVFICFDDGWKENLELIESIEKFKVPVTLFITTDAVCDGNFWWEYSLIEGQQKYSGIKSIEDFKKLPESAFNEKIAILKRHYRLERSCMTLEDLKEISGNQFITIGSHTVTHPIMSTSSYETQSIELSESKRILSQWLNKDIIYLSYPNGDYNDDTIQIAQQCGYKLCFTTNTGVIDVENVNPYIIPRNSLYDSGGYYENLSKILGAWQKFFPVNSKSPLSDV